MSAVTDQQQSLQAQWSAVFEGSGQAIDWVEQVADGATEVRGVSEALTRKLYKARNVARSLRRVATTPMGIGFFGLSQAGKSHFINTLAADETGQLRSQFGAHELVFEDHVNPQGGGAEATGVVTRLSSQSGDSGDANFPVELRLFREIELAIVLVNSWYEEFDHDTDDLVKYRVTPQSIDAVFASLEQRAAGKGSRGMASEDVAALFEYVESHWRLRAEVLRTHGYWKRAIKLAPKLTVDERGQLFSVLWGRVPQLTQAYVQFAQTLQRLGGAETAYAGLDCLVTQEDGHWARRNSVMNVNTLHLLGKPSAPSVMVRPCVQGQLQAPVMVSVPELTALTSELVFRLKAKPRNEIVERVDLLDFPGYRTRTRNAFVAALTEQDNGISNFLLRGKVAYLFEQYAEAQEMNALVVCTSSTEQSNVVGVAQVLGTWINKTQGDSPAKRAGHKPGLFWILTKCDDFVSTTLIGAESGYREAAEGLMKKTILERYGMEPWMREWAPGQAFNNTYMTRAPQFTKFTNKADGSKYVEESFDDKLLPLLEKLGSVVVKNEDFQRHVNEPQQTWDGMLALNDGGMKRFSDRIEGVADVGFKLKRIEAQLSEVREDLLPALERFYEAGGEGEAKKQAAIANQIVGPLLQPEMRPAIGELLAAMAVPATALRELYLHGNFDEIAEACAAAAQVSQPEAAKPAVASFDIFGNSESDVSQVLEAAQTQVVPELQGHDHLFARAAVDLWIKHLREIPEREGLLQMLNLPKEPVLALVRELVRAAERLDVPMLLARKLTEKAGRTTKLDDLVDRQVLTTRLMLDDFAAWFDYLRVVPAQRPNALLGGRKPVFAYLAQEVPQGLPKLPAEVADSTVLFTDDWLSGVALNTRDNTGHRKGREITPEQNEALGHVLTVLRGSAQ